MYRFFFQWNACVLYQNDFPFSCAINSQSFLPLPLRLLYSPLYVLSFNFEINEFWLGTNFLRPDITILYY